MNKVNTKHLHISRSLQNPDCLFDICAQESFSKIVFISFSLYIPHHYVYENELSLFATVLCFSQICVVKMSIWWSSWFLSVKPFRNWTSQSSRLIITWSLGRLLLRLMEKKDMSVRLNFLNYRSHLLQC